MVCTFIIVQHMGIHFAVRLATLEDVVNEWEVIGRRNLSRQREMKLNELVVDFMMSIKLIVYKHLNDVNLNRVLN